MSARQLLEKQLELLEIEREEDLRQYHQQVLKRSLKDRVEKGVSWYPLNLVRQFIGTGDHVVLDLERQALPDAKNSLQAGNSVTVFGMNQDKEVGHASGVIYHIRKNFMRVILATQEPPYWIHSARLGVNLNFDDKTYREMKTATSRVLEAENNRLSELREILIGNGQPSFGEWDYQYSNPILNRSQNKAIQRLLEAKDVALIHGPPGTGKTTTLVQAILETSKREHQILICAPSNTAVDLLTLRCAAEGLNVLRVGNPARVEEELHYHTLDETISRHPDHPSLRKMRKEAEALYRQANKYKRNFDKDAYHKRRKLVKEARDFKNYAETLEEYILNQVIDQAQVIACTLTGAANPLIARRKFYSVFIDEAAQALAPACWIAISRASRVILAGDHHQLPPTVKSSEAEKGGLGKTLFESLIEHAPISILLDEQYRMHDHIMGFSSRQFYEGKLRAAPGIGGRSLGEGFEALEFVDTAGCGFDEKKNDRLSTYNTDEAMLLLKHLALLFSRIESERKEMLNEHFSVGIISPYKAQVKKIEELMAESPMLSTFAKYITINTVDGFQGQEKDVVYISLVRSNESGEIGFLKDYRRMNVALTRARKKLVLFGNSATLGNNTFYKKFLDYVDEVGAYKTAWEFAG